jgi:two-component system chemotaxis response regulator CheY
MAKILSIDDSISIRELVSTVLSQAGHEVVTAHDGETGLDIARNDNFDLVLSDINMPGMSGISLISKLRRLQGFEHIPMIMLTTESDAYKKQKAKSMGATGWLQKPFTPERLTNTVKKLVG